MGMMQYIYRKIYLILSSHEKYFYTLNYLQIFFSKDPKWPTYLEKTSSEMWSFLCPEEFTYFEGWCYSLRNASDFVEADCFALNSTMVSEPDYKVNYFIAGKLNTLLLLTIIFGDDLRKRLMAFSSCCFISYLSKLFSK